MPQSVARVFRENSAWHESSATCSFLVVEVVDLFGSVLRPDTPLDLASGNEDQALQGL